MLRRVVQLNIGLAGVFCLAVALLPILSISDGGSWVGRLLGFPKAITDALSVAPDAAVVSLVLPLGATAVCAAALVFLAILAPRLHRIVVITCTIVVTLLAGLASALIRDLSILVVALIPLAFAFYATTREERET